MAHVRLTDPLLVVREFFLFYIYQRLPYQIALVQTPSSIIIVFPPQSKFQAIQALAR